MAWLKSCVSGGIGGRRSGRLKTFAARSLLLKLAQRQELRLPPVREAMRRSPWGLGRPELRLGVPAASPAAGSQFEQLAALGVADGGARFAGTGARPGLPAALSLSGLQSSGGHALALLGAGRSGAGFGRSSGGCRGLAVRAAGSLYRLEWGGARGGLAPDWQSQSFSHFALGARAPFGQPFIGRISPAALRADWPAQHGWRLELLETFVETGRFKGVAYRAANWQPVGLTTGRTRQEKEHRPQAPRKSVWVYPLGQGFRRTSGGAGQPRRCAVSQSLARLPLVLEVFALLFSNRWMEQWQKKWRARLTEAADPERSGPAEQEKRPLKGDSTSGSSRCGSRFGI